MLTRSPIRPAPSRREGLLRSDLALGLTAGALAVAAAVGGHRLGGAELGLHALPAGGTLLDSDADGLSDAQEEVLLSNPLVADTDADGVTDREEIARGSDPLVPESVLLEEVTGVGILGVVDGATLLLEVLVYIPGPTSNLFATNLYFGAYFDGQLYQLPLSALLAVSSVTIEPAATGDGLVVGVASAWDANAVAAVGAVSFWAAAGPFGEAPVAGAALNLVTSGGVLNSVSTTQSVGGSQQGAGAAYRPIVPSDQLPSSFSPGQLCVQELGQSGSEGAVSVFEVQSASCEPADAYCSPECPSTAGQVLELIDPLALIGG